MISYPYNSKVPSEWLWREKEKWRPLPPSPPPLALYKTLFYFAHCIFIDVSESSLAFQLDGYYLEMQMENLILYKYFV